MSYEIIAKYSDDLNNHDWLQIKTLFNEIFNKNYDLDYFKKKYFSTPIGFSCHGILYHNNVLVGCFTITPREYFVEGKIKLIGTGCDAFISETHRTNPFFLR